MPRYTIDFDDKFDSTLSELINSTDSKTKADVIRRAVATYKYLKDNAKENKVVITSKDGDKDVILP